MASVPRFLLERCHTMWRHGDVMIAAVERIPADAKKLPHRILAKGEITGHAHRLGESDDVALFEADGQSFLAVLSGAATVLHEEHHAIRLPQGNYRFWIQREYTPAEIVRVRD
jgi:hypothetical protein